MLLPKINSGHQKLIFNYDSNSTHHHYLDLNALCAKQLHCNYLKLSCTPSPIPFSFLKLILYLKVSSKNNTKIYPLKFQLNQYVCEVRVLKGQAQGLYRRSFLVMATVPHSVIHAHKSVVAELYQTHSSILI